MRSKRPFHRSSSLRCLALTGVELQVPAGAVIGDLVATVLLLTVVGVWLRTRYPAPVGRFDPLNSAGGSLVYLTLLLAVLGPNATSIPGTAGMHC